jgi:hypothetical protein
MLSPSRLAAARAGGRGLVLYSRIGRFLFKRGMKFPGSLFGAYKVRLGVKAGQDREKVCLGDWISAVPLSIIEIVQHSCEKVREISSLHYPAGAPLGV